MHPSRFHFPAHGASVYWLQPPPYLRWAAAAVLVVGAFLWDLRVPLPNRIRLQRAISAGARLGADDIVWRRLPEGAFTVPDLTTAVAAVDLEAGEPISAVVLAGPIVVPDGWWAIPIDVSSHAGPGDEVLLIVVDPPLTLSGIVIEPQVGDATSLDHRPALVAVPGITSAARCRRRRGAAVGDRGQTMMTRPVVSTRGHLHAVGSHPGTHRKFLPASSSAHLILVPAARDG